MNELNTLLGTNIVFSLWIAYVAGVATSLTPCMYPLIPITVGVIGAQTTRKLRSFFLAVLYVLGMAITYTVLGITASIGGKIFGLTAYNPWVNILIGLILLVFGLNMFGVIKIPLPGAGINAAKIKSTGVKKIFMLGLLSGLVTAPCSTPVLGSILTFVSVNRDIFRGGSMLFVYGFGSGTMLIVVGTFAGIAASLPKSGKWMSVVKYIMGVVIFLAAMYFFIRAYGHLSGFRR
jgi:thiol:disulfide interchange protein DsbD